MTEMANREEQDQAPVPTQRPFDFSTNLDTPEQADATTHGWDEDTAAPEKSYTNSAALTLILWLLFWPAGLIMNWVYLGEARRTQQVLGRAPEGKGCLTALMIVFFWLPLTVVGVLIIALVVAQNR